MFVLPLFTLYTFIDNAGARFLIEIHLSLLETSLFVWGLYYQLLHVDLQKASPECVTFNCYLLQSPEPTLQQTNTNKTWISIPKGSKRYRSKQNLFSKHFKTYGSVPYFLFVSDRFWTSQISQLQFSKLLSKAPYQFFVYGFPLCFGSHDACVEPPRVTLLEGEAPTAEVDPNEWLRDTDALVFFICGFG